MSIRIWRYRNIIIIIIINLNEENKTFKFEKRHVSATPVPSSVYGWNYNDEQCIAENWNNNGMIQQLITKKD